MAKYDNYRSQLAALRQAPEKDLSDEFIQNGIIGKFSLQFELAWKLLQKALQYDGRVESAAGSPRTIIKAAYNSYDFIDEDLWLSMLDARNEALHVYNSDMARDLVDDIISDFIPAFDSLLDSLEKTYPAEVLNTFWAALPAHWQRRR